MSTIKPSSPDQFFNIYLFVLAISPWPLGGNRDWAWPLITLIWCGVAIVLAWREPREISLHAKLVLGSIFILILWMLFQLIGIPPIVPPISIDYFSTRSDLLKTIGIIAFVWSTLQLVDSSRRVELLIYTVVITALLQALLGGVQVFMLDSPSAQGSFPNRNHFAGYLVASVALGLGLLIARMKVQRGGSALETLIDVVTGPQARLRILLLIIVIGLVLSRSRGGNLALMSAILISAGVYFSLARSINRKILVLLVSVLILDISVIGGYFGIERVAERIQQTTLATESRDELTQYSWLLFKDHWLAGTGAGTYEIGFTAYRGPDISAHVTHAENDYLEFMVELGIIGVVPLIVMLIAGIMCQVAVLRSRSSTFSKGIAFGCLMGVVAMLLHSTVEFNLQIPAVSTLMVLMLVLPMCLFESDHLQ